MPLISQSFLLLLRTGETPGFFLKTPVIGLATPGSVPTGWTLGKILLQLDIELGSNFIIFTLLLRSFM